MEGFFFIDKQKDGTTFDVIRALKRGFRDADLGLPKKFKIGHCGTLDPIATGLVLVAIGSATKLLEYLQDMDNPYPPSPERIEAGREIYFGKGLCVTCHSHDGKGVELPGHTPRDFTDPKWQDIRTDGEMMWVLRNGSPGTQMPVRVGKVISEEEGWNVIHFIRTFSQAD